MVKVLESKNTSIKMLANRTLKGLNYGKQIEEQLEKELELEARREQSAIKRFRKKGEHALHNKVILFIVIGLCLIDCCLVLGELILDLYSIKGRMVKSNTMDDNFIADMKSHYPQELQGINDIESLFQKIIDGNLTWYGSHASNQASTGSHILIKREINREYERNDTFANHTSFDNHTMFMNGTASILEHNDTIAHQVKAHNDTLENHVDSHNNTIEQHAESHNDTGAYYAGSFGNSTLHGYGSGHGNSTLGGHGNATIEGHGGGYENTTLGGQGGGHIGTGNGGAASHGVVHGVPHHTLEEEIGHGFHLGSVAILCVLCFETILKILFSGKRFFIQKLETFDAFVVAVSLILDLVYIDGFTKYAIHEFILILAFLLPWRVIRVVNSLVVAVMDHEHFKLKLIYGQKKKAEKNLTSMKKDLAAANKRFSAIKVLCRTKGATEDEIEQSIEAVEEKKEFKNLSKMSKMMMDKLLTTIMVKVLESRNTSIKMLANRTLKGLNYEKKIEEQLEKELELEAKREQSAIKRFRKKGEHVLHSKVILFIVIGLCLIDCGLVLGELILDLYSIKGRMETTKNQDDQFIADMKNRYTHELRDINDIESLFHKIIDANMTWGGSHVSNDDNTGHSCDTNDDQTTAGVTLSHDGDEDGSNHTSYENQTLFMNDNISTERDYGELEHNGTTPYYVDSHNETENENISDGHANVDNHGGTQHLVHTLEEEVGHGFHLGSVAILCVLCFETIFKVFFSGRRFFTQQLETFDAFIVMVSLILDLVFLDGFSQYEIHEFILILAFLLPWRVIRVVNSLVVAVMDHEHLKLKLIYGQKKKAEKNITSLKKDLAAANQRFSAIKALCRTKGGTEEEIELCIETVEEKKEFKNISKMTKMMRRY